MEIEIRVNYYSNKKGAGKLKAVGMGHPDAKRQATVGYPHELSSSLKYYEAARELAFKLENKNEWNLRLVRRSSNDSCISGEAWESFHYEVFDRTVPTFDNHSAFKYDRLPAGYATGY